MPAKKNGLVAVKINTFIHGLAKYQLISECEKEGGNLSMIELLTNLVSRYTNIPEDILSLRLLQKIHGWGGPWKWVYLRQAANPDLTSLVNSLNRGLSPNAALRLPQGINNSNVLSALLLTEALNEKIIFKAQHIETNFGYRLTAFQGERV